MGWPHLVLTLLIALPVQAGPFKCVQPDGGVVYQQGPCSASDQGGELAVDTRSPGGAGSVPQAGDLSVEGQLKALEAARAKERKARASAARRASDEEPAETYDRAKCAKHRAQTASWRDEVRGGYRTQEEKTHDRHMLEYHEALVERYCAPD
jgi:hypothetical protein